MLALLIKDYLYNPIYLVKVISYQTINQENLILIIQAPLKM